MKRTIIILTISATLLLAGILYGGHTHKDYVRTLNVEEAYTAYFPKTMPDLIMEPMVGIPLY